MNILLAVSAALLFLIGLAYLYWPKFILKINDKARQLVFNDVKALLNRKKIGLVCVSAGLFIFFFGIVFPPADVSTEKNRLLSGEIVRIKLYQAYRQFYLHNYDTALARCQDILAIEPNNVRILELTGRIYLRKGENIKARAYLNKVIQLNPGNVKVKDYLAQTLIK